MFQPPHTITIHLHSSNIVTRFPFYSPFFPPLPKLVILFFFNKLTGISILKIELKFMSREEKNSNDPSSPLKKKEKESEGRSKAWWLMEGEGEGSLLGGQWKVKVPCLVVNGT
jgi:hypothetical protein